MPLNSTYVSKTPDANGLFRYSDAENSVWAILFERQMAYLETKACHAWLDGCDALGLTAAAVPQVKDIDARLAAISGAGVAAVDALIPQNEFSSLLKNRRFPMATFIRRHEHLDYIEEPDIFHECFGHCPMLTNDAFCRFMERFGALSLGLGEAYSAHLFRLFWFTVEFGLIREDGDLKAFGAGIMSSPAEARHATSGAAETLDFDPMTILRTPYRIDIVQPVYFVIDSFEQLADSLDADIKALIDAAAGMGDLPARFDAAA